MFGRITNGCWHGTGLQADSARPVLVPGDPERMHMAEVDKRGGVSYVPQQITSAVRDHPTRIVQREK